MAYPGQGGYSYGAPQQYNGGFDQYNNGYNQPYNNNAYNNNGYDNSGYNNNGFDNTGYNNNGFNNGYNNGYNTGSNSGFDNSYGNNGYSQPYTDRYGGDSNSGYTDRFGGFSNMFSSNNNNQQNNMYNAQPRPSQQQSYNQSYNSGYNNQQATNGASGNFRPPPQQALSFGVQGLPSYQYSNCSGRRKALLIGINYTGSRNRLRGCINDVRNVKAFLERNGYREQDMVILTDEPQRGPKCQPTRDNILRGFQWLVSGARTNDSLFLHYSGHGGQTEDKDGDEEDGYDEVIYPVDHQRAGHIVDDQIHAMIVRPLMPGVRLTALFDSCHSGTVLDLPYVYSTKGMLKEPNLLKEAGMGAMGALQAYSQGDIGSTIRAVTGLLKRVSKNNPNAAEKTKRTRTAPCDAILISGCKDSQTSADAFEAGQATGAMSYAFIMVMSRNPNQSYLSLLNEMRMAMQGRYTQKPQLSASHPIDVNLKFIF